MIRASNVFALLAVPPACLAQQARPDSVMIRIAGSDLRTAVQIVQQYLDRPVIFIGPPGPSVSLETPHPVARGDVVGLLRGLLESQSYELVEDSASKTYRARPREIARSSAGAAPLTSGIGEPRRAASPELFVIALKHARAANVASTLNSLFGRGSPSSPNGSSTPTLGDQLRAMQTPVVDAPTIALPSGGGRVATLTGEITIVADAPANCLLIRANRADFDLLRSAVDQLDVRPAQVLIEVLIVEARRDRNFSLGVEAGIDDHHVPNTANTTLGGTFSPGAAGLGDFTLKVMGVGPWDFDATIRAAASRGDVRIVSRPVVLTANDEQAEVVVGSQRPFVQVSRSLPTDAAVRDQVVQYRDVGTKLSVRPTISIDGTVALAVTQEVSSATAETAFNAPVISTRSVKTDLLVHDAQTIVLGGLTDRQHDVQASGVPVLSRLPFIGGLFGSQARSSNETELFIFLTPRVIRTDEDARRLTDPLRDRAGKIQP